MSLPSPALATPASQPAAASRAGYALLVLSLINLVNYLDRYIIAAALPRIQEDFGITKAQAGLFGTVFIVVLMLASPLGGILGDR
jgi:MFS transporter, Spinster family, sphingosine-1-phosphate transporter